MNVNRDQKSYTFTIVDLLGEQHFLCVGPAQAAWSLTPLQDSYSSWQWPNMMSHSTSFLSQDCCTCWSATYILSFFFYFHHDHKYKFILYLKKKITLNKLWLRTPPFFFKVKWFCTTSVLHNLIAVKSNQNATKDYKIASHELFRKAQCFFQ